MLITNRQTDRRTERFINMRHIYKYLNTQPSYSLKQTKLFENGLRNKSTGRCADCDGDGYVESCVWAVSAREYMYSYTCMRVCVHDYVRLAAVNWNKKLFVYFKISKSNQNEYDYSSERLLSTHCSLSPLSRSLTAVPCPCVCVCTKVLQFLATATTTSAANLASFLSNLAWKLSLHKKVWRAEIFL